MTVGRIEYETTWPTNHATAYVVAGDEPVMVDAGAPEQTTRTHRALARLDLDLADVEHLLVTHPHPHHLGQLTTVLPEGETTVVDALHGDDDIHRTVPEVMSVLAFLEEAGRLDTVVRDHVVHYCAS